MENLYTLQLPSHVMQLKSSGQHASSDNLVPVRNALIHDISMVSPAFWGPADLSQQFKTFLKVAQGSDPLDPAERFNGVYYIVKKGVETQSLQ